VQQQTAAAIPLKELNLSDKALQAEREKQIAALNELAVERGKTGDYRGAVQCLEQARALCATPAGVKPGLYPRLLANLAESYEELSQWGHAIGLLREAAAAEEQAFGARDPRTARLQVQLASALVVTGNFAEAQPLLQRAIAIQRADPNARQFEIALSLTSMALLDLNVNRPAEAEQNAEEAVALAQTEKIENPDYASMLGVLGAAYVVEGKRARALPLLTRAIDIIERDLSPTHPRLAPLLIDRGLVEAGDRKYALAEADMRRAIDLLDRSAMGTNGDWARFRLARIYMDQRKLGEAEETLGPAVERQRTLTPNAQLPHFIRALAELRQLQKRYDEAGSLYREAIALMREGDDAARMGDTAALDMGHPAREKDVRRLAQRANEIFGDSL